MELDRRGLFEAVTYEGKRVVVTGCASGMGEAVARQLGDLGAEVHGLDFQECRLERLKSFSRFDLRDAASIEAAATRVGPSAGPIDALFNCAGLPTGFPPIDIMKVNYIGTRHLTSRLLPFVADGGSVASISSAGGGLGWARKLPALLELLAIEDFASAVVWCEAHAELVDGGYALAKEAIVVWTMKMASQLAPRRIRINCTLPGATQTPMMADHFERQSKAAVELFARPIGRRSSPEEQARALIFLNSDAAAYISGACLPVDGGFLAAVTVGDIDIMQLLAAPASQSTK